MTELVVRRLLIDLETPLPRHWCGGDPFRTALFNALSMSFPVGEQFFIDAVRDGLKLLPEEQQDAHKAEVQGVIGQEATHRRIHALFNGHLGRQGLVNHWSPRIQKRMKMLDGVDPRHPLAITAANEHFTAILAEWLLSHPEVFGQTEERLQTMWLWHSAEEAEHKNTAFDLYQTLDGSYKWRATWFRRVTLIFLGDTLRQTVNNLHHDGTLWQWRTWKSAATTLFGAEGLIRRTYKPWREYIRLDFHPSQQESALSDQWLANNREAYTLVGARATVPTPA